VTAACEEEKAWLCRGRSIGLTWPPPPPRDVVGRAIGQEDREPPPPPPPPAVVSGVGSCPASARVVGGKVVSLEIWRKPAGVGSGATRVGCFVRMCHGMGLFPVIIPHDNMRVRWNQLCPSGRERSIVVHLAGGNRTYARWGSSYTTIKRRRTRRMRRIRDVFNRSKFPSKFGTGPNLEQFQVWKSRKPT